MLLFYSASQTIFFSYRICKKIWGSSDLFYTEFRVPCETVKDSTEDCELCRCSRGSVAWRSIRSKLYRVWWRLFQQRVIHFDQIPSDSSLDLSLNQVFDLLCSKGTIETAWAWNALVNFRVSCWTMAVDTKLGCCNIQRRWGAPQPWAAVASPLMETWSWVA